MGAGKVLGRTAIVTGGARGMGEAHVRALVEEGARVLCGDVLGDEGRALATELGEDSVRFFRLDVTSEDDWKGAVALAEEIFGPVSILVNNAGILRVGAIDEQPVADFRLVLEVNTVGTFLGMRSVVGSMRRAGGGSIINISSTAGMAGTATLAAYVSSKFAVRGMTKVAALELGKDNIRVNSIHPGGVATPMVAGMGAPDHIPIPRFAAPVEVSKMVLFLASDDSSYSTGSEFIVDGGLLSVVGQNTL